VWLEGFLGESADMNSCFAGTLERAVTGLRSIGDEELNAVFSVVEGPMMVNMFIQNTLNITIPANARKLVSELKHFGVVKSSECKDVMFAIGLYIDEVVKSNHVDSRTVCDSVKAIMETLEDMFDDTLKPLLDQLTPSAAVVASAFVVAPVVAAAIVVPAAVALAVNVVVVAPAAVTISTGVAALSKSAKARAKAKRRLREKNGKEVLINEQAIVGIVDR